jgi:hypothetical protein
MEAKTFIFLLAGQNHNVLKHRDGKLHLSLTNISGKNMVIPIKKKWTTMVNEETLYTNN